MEAHRTLVTIGVFLCVSAVSSYSSNDGRLINFLLEKRSGNFAQLYNEHLMRLRRSTRNSAQSQSQYRIGRCIFEDFLKSAQNCTARFYESVRSANATRSQCKDTFETLQSCMMTALTNCTKASFFGRGGLFSDKTERLQRNFLTFLGDQEFWCVKGGLGVSSEFVPEGYNCDPMFYHASESCTTNYRKMFRTNARNNRLCKEYEKAKNCYVETLFRHCLFDRKVRYAVEIMVQMSDDLQPFCKRPIEREEAILDRLILHKSCPPYSLTDVAFALDVTNGTARKQFVAMKRMVENVVRRMDYGPRGIQVAVFQFDNQVRNILKFGRRMPKPTFQKFVRRMTRTKSGSKSKARRFTGRALSSLGGNTFSPGKTGELVKKTYKSGQRPHNPAVLFVMTSGRSDDSLSAGLEILRDRNVHVVLVGPSVIERVPQEPRKTAASSLAWSGPSPAGSHIIDSNRVIVTTDFKFRDVRKIGEKLANEICTADRRRQLHSSATAMVVEGEIENSRFADRDLLHLFELTPIVSPAVTPTLPAETIPNGILPPGPIYEGGMDGDLFMPRQLPPNRWPFYMNDNEYHSEVSMRDDFFRK